MPFLIFFPPLPTLGFAKLSAASKYCSSFDAPDTRLFELMSLQLRPLRYLGLLPDPFRPSDTISDCSFRTLLDRWHYFRPTGGSGIPVCLGNINVINLRKKGVKEEVRNRKIPGIILCGVIPGYSE
ncbi:hypothetical protein RhiirA1_397169 [Rhizophagus irregularis]|uniref:Uncharacterized protein n=1 Tax=Rhizophagus irregularis TaxID=588596 RepID=A0A2I1EXE7_9GLOM|nr:hypothetical protein RhiirA1_397169 [Rhizophagus irregularis]PKY26784.1 hypothetical protein RhiirB3_389814 [Rhizophagus irregularis]